MIANEHPESLCHYSGMIGIDRIPGMLRNAEVQNRPTGAVRLPENRGKAGEANQITGKRKRVTLPASAYPLQNVRTLPGERDPGSTASGIR